MPQAKSLQTKEHIETVFWQLLSEHPLNEVTIKRLTKACGINRNTFYYHFKNIPSLIESIVHRIIDDLVATHPLKTSTIEESLMIIIDFARDNAAAINHIYHSTNRTIFERHLWHVCDYAVSTYLASVDTASPFPEGSPEREVVKNFLKYEFFGFTIDWINHGMPEIDVRNVQILASLFKPTGF